MTRRAQLALTCAAAYVAILFFLFWTRSPRPAYLVGAVIATLVTGAILTLTILRRRRERDSGADEVERALPLGLLLAVLLPLVLATGVAIRMELQLERLGQNWRPLVAAREARLREDLSQSMNVLVARTRRTAALTAEAAARARFSTAGTALQRRRDLFVELASLRQRADIAALAVFDTAGSLVAWAGEHHGPIPPEVVSEGARFAYLDRPLFSYLYISEEVPGGGAHAVAAVLLQSTGSLPRAVPGDYAHRFESRTGAMPHFSATASAADSWVLVAGGDTVVTGQFDPLTQASWYQRVTTTGARLVLLLAMISLIVLLAGWMRAGRRAGGRVDGWPLAALAVALAIAPLGRVGGLDRIFPPLYFLLPVPGDVSLVTLVAVMLPVTALVATRRAPLLGGRMLSIALGAGAVAVGVGFAGSIRLLLAGATPQLLQGGVHLWAGLQGVSVLLVALLPALAFPASRPRGGVRKPYLIGGGVVAVLLGLIVIGWWEPGLEGDLWTPALWAVPYLLIARGLAPVTGLTGRLLRWTAAGWLAATAVIPHLWIAHLDARFDNAERELATLGARADPYVESLLHRFAEEAERRAAAGEDGFELLYRSWLASGLARESVPVQLTLWSHTGETLARLHLGADDPRQREEAPQWFVGWVAARAMQAGTPVVEATREAPGVNQMLAAPLGETRLVTVIVPPRRSLGHSTVLAPLLGEEARGDVRLTLVPMRGGRPYVPGVVRWEETDRGWRSETIVRFPEGAYHAHLELRVASTPVRAARALLLLFTDLLLLALLWVFGNAMRAELHAPPGGWRRWVSSFRARVTLALFAFFLIPTAVFGAVAYRALAGEVDRAAAVLAEHVVAQAALMFPDSAQDLRVVAGRVGEEVLYYQGGELLAASSPEAVDLGLYGAWLPAPVFLTLQSGEETSTAHVRDIGAHGYLVAYNGSSPAGTVAVPVSLETGDIAVRQRELTDLILFTALIGGLLSLALSVLVARTLARPIAQLSRVAAAVGGGRLGVRLPESRTDEFGVLFTSFNRMVRRLRRARAREARTQRVLAWGEMARQVAHEIKNPLTPIKLSVQHLRRAFADRRANFGEILETHVDQILLEIDRLSEIARAFSRYGAPAEAAGPLEPVSVEQIVRESLTLYRSEEMVQYIAEVEPALPRVVARTGELKEVLLNLLENARTAIQGSGRVMVVARQLDDHVELSVEDSGVGIPGDLVEKIFDPHFSTTTGGTGLGLAIVRRLVESWGGTVSAESRLSEGTAVRVRMRAMGDTAQPAP